MCRKGLKAMIPCIAEPADAMEIVNLIRGGFPGHLMEGLVYGAAGIHHFVADQLRLGSLSPYRYRIIRDKDASLLAAAEFRIVGDALFLNYVAVRPDALRQGLAITLISAMRSEASAQGLLHFILDVFTHNEIAINWYVNKWQMEPKGLTRAWVAPLVQATAPCPYLISDFAQAESIQNRLGFSEFSLVGGPTAIRIGRMGSQYFRIPDPEAAADPGVIAALNAVDPTRSLLVLANGAHSGCSGWDLLYATQRLQTHI